MTTAPALVEARGLVKTFAASGGRGRVRAVDGVDLVVGPGETVGLVGESGSGKSTLGRLLVRLAEPDAGSIRLDGIDLLALGPRALRTMRRQFQIVFQDPASALNPRMRVGSLVAEPLAIHGMGASRDERRELARRLVEEVGLDGSALDRFPHEFSGGERQRIGIARAIACRPRFLVCDEPVSALDAKVRAQIVDLLASLQERHGIAYLFVAHDLRLVRRTCGRVAVMYLGRIVEEAPSAALFEDPQHPYTRALLLSAPAPRPGPPTPPAIAGEPPSPADPPAGCAFHPRCPVALPECSRLAPRLLPAGAGRTVACHRVHPPA